MTIYQPGDLLFFWGTDRVSRLIRWGTMGPSHVGMVVKFNPEGLLLVEATTLLATPCLVKGKLAGVQANDIEARIKQYTSAGGKAELWRLGHKYQLTEAQENLLSTNAFHRYLGKPYNVAKAVTSGANFTNWWLKRRFGWLGYGAEDRTSFFCSKTAICQLQDVDLFLRDKSYFGWFDVKPSDYSPAEFRRSVRSLGLYQREAVFTAASEDSRAMQLALNEAWSNGHSFVAEDGDGNGEKVCEWGPK